MDTSTIRVIIAISVTALIVPSSSEQATGSHYASFEKVTDNWSYYIDKTLFIKALLEKETPSKILIRAPFGYGKSTNLDMVKRFLQINFQNESHPEGISNLHNYKLFTSLNRLKVCKHKKLFHDHFGKYPVIFIDYSPLSNDGISSFDNVLSRISRVLRNSFMDHNYLLRSLKLWSTTHNKTATQVQFHKFLGQRKPYKNVQLSEKDIKNGFTLLAQLLFKEFGKPAFVLIDDFDTYTDKLDFASSTDADRIVAFIQSVTGELLKSNWVDRALLMSTHHQTNNNGNSYCHVNNDVINNITEYKFFDNHAFNKYHGLAAKEMETLLLRTIDNVDERRLTTILINDHVVSHLVGKENAKLYKLLPVMNFLRHRIKNGFRLVSSDF